MLRARKKFAEKNKENGRIFVIFAFVLVLLSEFMLEFLSTSLLGQELLLLS